MRIACKLLLVATALISGPLLAQQKTTPVDLAALTNEQLNEKVRASGTDVQSVCRSVVYSDELARRRPVNAMVGFAAYRRGLCAWHSKRSTDALREFEFAEGLNGSKVSKETRAELEFMLVVSAVRTENWAALEEHALHMTGRDDPQEFAGFKDDLWQYVLFKAPLASRGKIALAFVRARSFGKLKETLQSLLADQAVKPALAESDAALAFALATREPSPYSMVSMLIDRDYAPLWPQLEAKAGPELGKELAANLTQAERDLAAAPGDLEKLTAVVQAQLWLNQPAAALALAQKIDHSPAAFATKGEHFGWLINVEVKALDLLGRSGEADGLFDQLAALDPETENRDWLVNFVINRADRLVGQGRWALALPASQLAVAVAAKHGSAYAREDSAASRYCAGIKLDAQRAELVSWWSEVEAGRLANIGSAVQAAQCKGDDGAARRFLREGLENEDAREQVLRLLQTRAVDFYRDEGNMFIEPRLLLQSDPALMALFHKYGRELPKEFEPTG